MTNDLNFEDLCNMIALRVGNGATINSSKKYMVALFEVILRQLELNHRIYIQDFGYFEIKERKSGERVIYDPNTGEKKLLYIEPKYSIFFKASEKFDFAINKNEFKIPSDAKIKKSISSKRTKTKRKKIKNFVDLINKAEINKEIIWRNGKATNKKK